MLNIQNDRVYHSFLHFITARKSGVFIPTFDLPTSTPNTARVLHSRNYLVLTFRIPHFIGGTGVQLVPYLVRF